MNIRCIIVDDEPLALNKLKRHVLKYPYMENICSSCVRSVKMIKTGWFLIIITLMMMDVKMPFMMSRPERLAAIKLRLDGVILPVL